MLPPERGTGEVPTPEWQHRQNKLQPNPVSPSQGTAKEWPNDFGSTCVTPAKHQQKPPPPPDLLQVQWTKWGIDLPPTTHPKFMEAGSITLPRQRGNLLSPAWQSRWCSDFSAGIVSDGLSGNAIFYPLLSKRRQYSDCSAIMCIVLSFFLCYLLAVF